MKVFISYHRADEFYREKVENILNSKNIDYYAVPLDANFDGQAHEKIKTFLTNKIRSCDVLLCLIGRDTYSRPHVDREIHKALQGEVGKRKVIIGVHLDTRIDTLQKLNSETFPTKLLENKDYVILCNYKDLNSSIEGFIQKAIENSENLKLQTTHENQCMPLRAGKYYDNN